MYISLISGGGGMEGCGCGMRRWLGGVTTAGLGLRGRTVGGQRIWGEEVPSGQEGRREGGRKRQRDRGREEERTKEEREVREEEREESGKEKGRDRGSARFLQILAQLVQDSCAIL